MANMVNVSILTDNKKIKDSLKNNKDLFNVYVEKQTSGYFLISYETKWVPNIADIKNLGRKHGGSISMIYEEFGNDVNGYFSMQDRLVKDDFEVNMYKYQEDEYRYVNSDIYGDIDKADLLDLKIKEKAVFFLY